MQGLQQQFVKAYSHITCTCTTPKVLKKTGPGHGRTDYSPVCLFMCLLYIAACVAVKPKYLAVNSDSLLTPQVIITLVWSSGNTVISNHLQVKSGPDPDFFHYFYHLKNENVLAKVISYLSGAHIIHVQEQ